MVRADTGQPSRTDPGISPPRRRAGVFPTAWRRPPLTESHRRRLTLLAMCVATFMIQLDVTIVNVALSSIQRELQVSSGGLEWVIGGYALSLAALIPVSGALGDRYGRRRIFLAGVVVFAAGSAACALSPDAIVLVAFRVLQGAGGAAMLALTLSIITDTFPPETRAGAIGTWAAVGGTGFGVGPAVGGILLTVSGWASVFWVNLPFAAIAIAITAVAVRPTRNPYAGRLDLPGAAASAAGLFAVTLGLTESASHPWGSGAVAGPIAAGAALLVGFVGWERRCPHAMIAPALLRARSFVSASAVYLISYTAFSGVLFYVTLLYQDVNGWSPLRTGLSWLFMNAPFLLAAQLTGRLDRRFPAAGMVAAGCVAGAAGVFALSLAAPTTPFVVTAVGFLLCGAGFGLLVPGVTHVAMRDVPPEMSGAASGVVNASRQIGTSVGLAVLGTLGVTSAIGNWTATAQRFPAALRARALRQAQNVGGARINAVARALGAAYRQPAAQSFAHGYHVAVGVGAACLLAAAVIAILGFRRSAPEVAGADLCEDGAMIVVAPIEPADRASWEVLARGYKAFYETPTPDEGYEQTWRSLHDAGSGFHGLGAYLDGALVGIAHYLIHPLFWYGDACYLQDLFVAETARGHGAARALIEHLAETAINSGATRLYWTTKEDNHRARLLYDQVARFNGFIRYDYPL
jgi:MFS transporter, DHA2 family, methylenomycin A resistance protein